MRIQTYPQRQMTSVVLNLEPDCYSETCIKEWEKAGYLYAVQSDGLSPSLVKIILVRLNVCIDQALVESYPNLLAIICPATNISHIDTSLCRSKGIKVYSLKEKTSLIPDVSGTAELAWLLLMAANRKLISANKSVSLDSKWNRDDFRSFQLKSLRLGIVGMGRLGKKIALYSRSFDMECSFYDPYVNIAPNARKIFSLAELFDGSDAVILSLTSDKSTFLVIDKRLISSTRQKRFILVNISRGDVVDEASLVEAVSNNPDFIYATDVLIGEPSKIHSSPVWQMRSHPQIIITPHVGGACFDAMWRTEKFCQDLCLSGISSDDSI